MTTIEMLNIIDNTPTIDENGVLTVHGKLFAEFKNHFWWKCSTQSEISPFITKILRDMVAYHGRPNEYRTMVFEHFDAVTPMQIDDETILEFVVKLAGHKTVEGWFNEQMRRLYFTNNTAYNDIQKVMQDRSATPAEIMKAVNYARLQQQRIIGTDYKNTW